MCLARAPLPLHRAYVPVFVFQRVVDFSGKNYRLLQNNLEKDIIVGESSILVKRNKIIVKLQKVRGEGA